MAMSSIGFRKRNQYPYFSEGAAVCCLEIGKSSECIGFHRRVGYATEILELTFPISK